MRQRRVRILLFGPFKEVNVIIKAAFKHAEKTLENL